MIHGYVDFTVEGNDLKITLTPKGREMVKAALEDEQNIDSDAFLHDLFEDHTCNGWEWVGPEEIGALTSAPILTETAERDDQGTLTTVGRVYWFPNYQIESPMRTLYETGSVVFAGVA